MSVYFSLVFLRKWSKLFSFGLFSFLIACNLDNAIVANDDDFFVVTRFDAIAAQERFFAIIARIVDENARTVGNRGDGAAVGTSECFGVGGVGEPDFDRAAVGRRDSGL